MPALFRIVQDDHPPMPDGIGAAFEDFLLNCFTKDPNRRITASALLKHPWLKQAAEQDRALSNVPPTIKGANAVSSTPQKHSSSSSASTPSAPRSGGKAPVSSSPFSDDEEEDWDAEIEAEEDIKPLPSKGASSKSPAVSSSSLLSSTPHKTVGTLNQRKRIDDDDDPFDEIEDFDLPHEKVKGGAGGAKSPSSSSSSSRAKSPVGMSGVVGGVGVGVSGPAAAEKKLKNFQEDDEEDYGLDEEDIDLPSLTLGDKALSPLVKPLNGGMGGGGEEDEEEVDPFDDIALDEEQLANDEQALLTKQFMRTIASLNPKMDEKTLLECCERLNELTYKSPDLMRNLMTQHAVIPIIEMMETNNTNVLHAVLTVVNTMVLKSQKFQQNLSLTGLIPAIIRFGSRSYPFDIRLEVAKFFRQFCFTQDHQLLSKRRGWVDIADVEEEEEVATYNKEKRTLEYQGVIARIVRKEEGGDRLIEFTNAKKGWAAREEEGEEEENVFSCVTSDDHDWFVKLGRREGEKGAVWERGAYRKVKGGQLLPSASSSSQERLIKILCAAPEGVHPSKVSLTHLSSCFSSLLLTHHRQKRAFFSFYGFFLGRGISSSQELSFTFSSSKQRLFLLSCLKSLPLLKGIDYTVSSLSASILNPSWIKVFNQQYTSSYSSPSIDHSNVSMWKWMYEELNMREMRVVIKGLVAASSLSSPPASSSSPPSHRSILISSSSLRDDLSIAALHAGYSSHWSSFRSPSSSSPSSPVWRVTFGEGSSSYTTLSASSHSSSYSSNQTLYCVQVPNSLLFVRRCQKAPSSSTSSTYPSSSSSLIRVSRSFVSGNCYASDFTRKMFIACDGLPVLVELLEEDYKSSYLLIFNAIDCIRHVFDITTNPRNDFCRLFCKYGLLSPLTTVLELINEDKRNGEAPGYVRKIAEVLHWFAQGDKVVKAAFAKKEIIQSMLRVLPSLEQEVLILLLKSICLIAMDPTTLDAFESAGAIPALIPFLSSPFPENQHQVLLSMYYLCQIKASRQEQAAMCGLIPHLERFIRSDHPLKQFAYPIIFQLAKCSNKSRIELKKYNGVQFYIDCLRDVYWRSHSLEVLAGWLQEDTQRVGFTLNLPTNINKLFSVFKTTNDAIQFEKMLPLFRKMLSVSIRVNQSFGRSGEFISEIKQRLERHAASNNIRINLLKILALIFVAHPNPSLLAKDYGLMPILVKLTEDKASVIVVSLANKLVEKFKEVS